MKKLVATAVVLAGFGFVRAQGSPDVVWQEPTPNSLSNSVMGVSWSPVKDELAVGSTDRWFRLRSANEGSIAYSVLEPQHSNGVGQIIHSIDGGLIGVETRAFTMQLIVQQAFDGSRLGSILATVGQNGLVSFAPDAALTASTGSEGTMSRWRFSDLTMFQSTGSGYQRVSTAFNFSPDGIYQTGASRGTITVRRRTDGEVVRTLAGGSVVAFSPDGSRMAALSSTSGNAISIWRTSDWTLVHTLQSPDPAESVGSLRFSRDGLQLASTGYFPYLDADGLWQQKGIIRFWRTGDGTVLQTYDENTDLAVTSPVSWAPDGSRFAYGRYDGTVVVARSPRDSDPTGSGGPGTRGRRGRKFTTPPTR